MSVALNHSILTRPDPNIFSTTISRPVNGLIRVGVNRNGNRTTRGSVVKQSSLLGKKLYGARVLTGSVRDPKFMVRANLSLVPEKPLGLYDPAFDKDACGVGFVAELSGIGNRKTVCFFVFRLLNNLLLSLYIWIEF